MGTQATSTERSLLALAEELRREGRRAGLAAVGIAPATPMEATRRVLEERKAAGLAGGMQFTYRDPGRSTEPGRILPGAAALVVGAWPYGNQGAAGAANTAPSREGQTEPKGSVARYARRDHYSDLKSALGEMAGLLQHAGWLARVVADDNALVDRAAAHRAGLGWFGKNTNILLPGAGSWFLLGSVVTDAPLPTGAPVAEGCGTCQRCLPSCPTGALVAPGTLDARKCLAWLLQAEGCFPFEYREALGSRMYGCDDCQDTCPANRAVSRLATGKGTGGRPAVRNANGASADGVVAGSEFAGGDDAGGDYAGGHYANGASAGPVGAGPGRAGDGSVDILGLLADTDAHLLERFGRWYIPRRDPRYLRRNALIVLGNVGDGSAPEVEDALCHYLAGGDEMLRAHAVWAAVRIGRQDLLSGQAGLWGDTSALVRDELLRLGQINPRPAGPTAVRVQG